jgi:hypothetical protein
MTVIDDVRAHRPICARAIWDGGVTERLGLSVLQHANHKTRELAGSNGFERRKDICSMCAGEKLVIRRVK